LTVISNKQPKSHNRRRKNRTGFDNIFAGVIKCAYCGYAMRAGSMHRRKRPDIIDCVQYYKRQGIESKKEAESERKK